VCAAARTQMSGGRAPLIGRAGTDINAAGPLSQTGNRGNLCAMSASPIDEKKSDGTTRTLGDLLYADAAKTRIAERDWGALIQSIAAGDQGALHALYERTHSIVFTLIMRITGDLQTAEELTIDVFHDVWRRAPNYDAAGGTVLGWILNQARSRANDFEELVEFRQQGCQFRAALSALTPQERDAIEAAFSGDLTYAEVAARLDEPRGTIETRIRSALEKGRRTLTSGEDTQ